ncbi:MAG: hypothetical protein KatS3mg016_0180 [Fimbriimonadales bacterium]|nr:MAG: hypothetical protein KatS3mg016_0180 [Fimbriimonadales bacterium]
MKPRTIGWMLGIGLVLIAVIGWLSRNAAQGWVRMEDGSLVRVVGITRGTKHNYTPPFWRARFARLRLVEPYQGISDLIISTPEPRMYVWLQRRFPNPKHTRRTLTARLVDHKGAFIPVEVEWAPRLWNSREEIFCVQLPYLPADAEPVWLDFEPVPNRNSGRRLLINPPFVSRPVPSLKPHPLPARAKTSEFEVELVRLDIVEDEIVIMPDNKEYVAPRIVGRLNFYESGRRTNNWGATEVWLEDPFGNRYETGQAPPWHYPYWVYCAKFYRVGEVRSRVPKAWRSGWIPLHSGADTPLNALTTQYGVAIRVLGVFQRANQVFEVDLSKADRYRIRPAQVPLSSELNQDFPVMIHPAARADVWQVHTKAPVLLIHIPAHPNWQSATLTKTRFFYNDYEIFCFLQDEQGHVYPLPVVTYELGRSNQSILLAARLDLLPRTVRRGRVGITLSPPHVIRLPIPPLSKEQVLKVWEWKRVK